MVVLKKKFKELGMSTNGLKKDLVSRLLMEENKRERTEEIDKSQDESNSESESEDESDVEKEI